MSNFDPRELHELLILDPERHKRVLFDPLNRAQVEEAQKVYEAAMLKQFKAFGKEGPKNGTFDPTETRTIVTPAIRGG